MRFKAGILTFGLLAVCVAAIFWNRGTVPTRVTSSVSEPLAPERPTLPLVITEKISEGITEKKPANSAASLPSRTRERASEVSPEARTLRARVDQYISKRPIKVRGRSYSPLRGAVAILGDKVPPGLKEIARENDYVIVENRSGDALPEGARLALYDADNDNLIVATGMIRVKLHPDHNGDHIEKESGLSVAHSFPRLRTYFLQTPAATIDQLTGYLASARLLTGVVDARLDLIESRNQPQ